MLAYWGELPILNEYWRARLVPAIIPTLLRWGCAVKRYAGLSSTILLILYYGHGVLGLGVASWSAEATRSVCSFSTVKEIVETATRGFTITTSEGPLPRYNLNN